MNYFGKIGLVFVFLFSGWVGAADSSVDNKKLGQTVYKDKCLACHGEKWDGMGPAGKYLTPHPRNLITDKFKKGDSEEQIFETITEGIEGTSMVSFRALSEDQRRSVAAYIHSLRKK